MQCGRQLNAVHVEFARKVQPLFNGAVGIFIPDVTRSEFLQSGREYANFHEFRFEIVSLHRHNLLRFVVIANAVCYA